MDIVIPPANSKRKPDYKQMGLGGGIVMAILTLTPIKEWLFTREEGANLAIQVAELKTTIVQHNLETTRVIEQKADTIIRLIENQEARYARENDKQDRRLETVEAVILKAGKHL